MFRITVIALAAALVLVSSDTYSAAASTVIWPGVGIGSIRLGMTMSQLRRVTGRENQPQAIRPSGTLTVGGERLIIWTDGGRVVRIETANPHHRTSAGFGPGDRDWSGAAQSLCPRAQVRRRISEGFEISCPFDGVLLRISLDRITGIAVFLAEVIGPIPRPSASASRSSPERATPLNGSRRPGPPPARLKIEAGYRLEGIGLLIDVTAKNLSAEHVAGVVVEVVTKRDGRIAWRRSVIDFVYAGSEGGVTFEYATLVGEFAVRVVSYNRHRGEALAAIPARRIPEAFYLNALMDGSRRCPDSCKIVLGEVRSTARGVTFEFFVECKSIPFFEVDVVRGSFEAMFPDTAPPLLISRPVQTPGPGNVVGPRRILSGGTIEVPFCLPTPSGETCVDPSSARWSARTEQPAEARCHVAIAPP